MRRKSDSRNRRRSRHRTKQSKKEATVTGVFKSGARGGGVVVPDNPSLPVIRISRTACSTALQGDNVKVNIVRRQKGRDPRGMVIQITKRANTQILGQITHRKYCSEVRPLNQKINKTIEIRKKLNPAEVPDGSWVIAEILYRAATVYEPLKGKLVEVIGTEDDVNLPVQLLIRSSGIQPKFPPEVEEEAKALVKKKSLRAGKGRRDFRNRRIITIDPSTAKDFDDAISLHKADKNGWQIGIHIADVSHYIKEGTKLDEEAYERSTSIYPLNQVVHMLPESIANNLCSLRPDEDKLTMSVLFTVSRKGKVSDVKLFNSIIRSVKRLAYKEVQCLFNEADNKAGGKKDSLTGRKRGKKKQDYFPGNADPFSRQLPRPVLSPKVLDDLFQMRQVAKALRHARFQRGALKLEMPETEVLFDAEGKVYDLRLRQPIEAQSLIEEFMIAANEAVSRELEKKKFPALFRVHEKPDPDRLKAISPALSRLGIILPEESISRKELQAALDKAQDHRAYRIVQRWVLKSMMRARYQKDNIGHYGLASNSYIHFTSPIRRYPDMVAHRLVKLFLAGKSPNHPKVNAIREALPELGRHTTEREERAQKIEWDATSLFALQYMKQFVGDIFEGFISGISPMGFFVELADYPVEGLVRINRLDGYWDLDKVNSVWRARSSRRTFGPGDSIKVLIERVDELRGQMDLMLIRGRP